MGAARTFIGLGTSRNPSPAPRGGRRKAPAPLVRGDELGHCIERPTRSLHAFTTRRGPTPATSAPSPDHQLIRPTPVVVLLLVVFGLKVMRASLYRQELRSPGEESREARGAKHCQKSLSRQTVTARDVRMKKSPSVGQPCCRRTSAAQREYVRTDHQLSATWPGPRERLPGDAPPNCGAAGRPVRHRGAGHDAALRPSPRRGFPLLRHHSMHFFACDGCVLGPPPRPSCVRETGVVASTLSRDSRAPPDVSGRPPTNPNLVRKSHTR